VKAITSRDNPLYKQLKALAGSTHQQRRSGHALLEGFHLASAYLDVAGQPETCLITDGALRHDEAQAIVSRIDEHRIVTLPDALFGQLSNVVNGVGILLLVDKLAPPLPERVGETCVVLDGVQDAGNVGSILRSAAAAGIQQVFCAPGTAYAWSSKVLRSGMGAHFLLQIHEDVEPQTLIERLAGGDYGLARRRGDLRLRSVGAARVGDGQRRSGGVASVARRGHTACDDPAAGRDGIVECGGGCRRVPVRAMPPAARRVRVSSGASRSQYA
jgi:TrmH family RNA methyltransferase